MQLRFSPRLSAIALAVAFAAACGGDDVIAPTAENFTASLSGTKERPTPVTTPATGSASFTLSADGNTLSWNVNTTGLNNASLSHIHIGGPEVAGPIVLSLFGGPTTNNPTITGSVTRAAFTSPLGVSFDGLISLIRSGDTYVNVHTNSGVLPANTGPGNFPGGEIRGQITKS